MFGLAWAASMAAAQTVAFDLDEQTAQELGLDPALVEDQFGAAISDQLNLVDVDQYLQAFANADAIAMKGMGVDYASNPKKFSLGAALGSGVADVPLTFVRDPQSLPDGGYAFMASAYAGVNLGGFAPGDNALDHVVLYVNGMGLRPPGNKSFQASLYNVGAHVQVKLFGPIDAKVIEWGGVDLTGGFERSFYQLELSKALPLQHDVAPARFTWTATGRYTIASAAGTVPLEVSTNLRLLLLTAYTGFGVDVNTATATSTASLSGPVDAEVGGQSANLGTATVTLSGSASADPIAPRAFVGAQIALGPAKVFGQLNLGLNDAYGGFVGMRLAL